MITQPPSHGTYSATQAELDALIGASPEEILALNASPPANEHTGRAAATVPAKYTSKVEAALDHAARGFAVFPLVPNLKFPPKEMKGWPQRATTDAAQIKAWWAATPNANIGILTTPYLVVDIDPWKGGDTTAELLARTKGFPKTLCSRSGRGGSHMIYRLPEHVFVSGGADKLGKGVDIKSWGSFIVAPGSTVKEGGYAWLNDRPVTPAPQWLLDRCKAAKPRKDGAGKVLVDEDEESIARSIDYISTRAPTAEKGNRGYTAYKVACVLYGFGVKRETCAKLIGDWSLLKCDPPMDQDDVEHAAKNADKYMQKDKGTEHSKAQVFDAHDISASVHLAPKPEPKTSTAEPVPNRLSQEDYDKTRAYLFRDSPLVEGAAREPAASALATVLVETCSADQMAELMHVWNEAACEPELDAATLQSAIDGATRDHKASIKTLTPKAMADTVTAEIPFKEPWGKPADLWPSPVVQAELPLDAVPEIVARFAEDRGRRLGIAPGAAAAALVTSLASLVPAGNELQMRQRDPHWTVRPILWTAIIGEPGSNKSAALAAAVAPIKAIEDKWRLQYAAETRRVEMMRSHTGATKKDRSSTTETAQAPIAAARPVYRQKIVNDATTEALAPLLAENSSGLLCYVDELAGLFGSMDAYRQKGGKDRPFWLQAKDGGALTINRKTSERIVVKNCAISILGSIQPEKIRKLSAGLSDDGFLQRFSLVHIRRDGTNQDIPPDADLDGTLARVASNLVELPDFARFRFSPEADTELREIEAFKEREIARPNASNFIRQWLDKLPNEFGRVALAFHQIEWCTSDSATVFEDPAPELISVDTARRARRYLTEFIFSHTQAFALQAPQSSTGGDNAIWIAGFILAGERDTISARDIYRSYHAIRREDIPRVMGDLELLDWVRPIKFDVRGVATAWAVNPAVHDARFAEIAEAERIRRLDVRQKAAQGRLPEIQHAAAMGQG